MAPMRHGNPFILRLAGCHRDDLPFLFFRERRRSTRPLCICQERFNLPAIPGLAQGTRLLGAFQLVQFSLVALPTLTPATDRISSYAVFAGNPGLVAQLGRTQDETCPQDDALRTRLGIGQISHQFCLGWGECQFFHTMSIAELAEDF